MAKKACIFFSFVLLCLLLGGCGVNKRSIKRMQVMEEGVKNPTTIEELSDAIRKYERRAEDLIASQEQLGVWYKMLATRYLENQMYGEALSALEQAVHYYPANQNLYYYIGVSAGFMANAALDFRATGGAAERDRYLLLSESAYKRALELEPNYVRALYGLSVLYTYEMNQPAKAVPLLERALSVETKNTDAMLVLACANYMLYNYDAAVVWYDAILASNTSKEKKASAEALKKEVLDAMYQ